VVLEGGAPKTGGTGISLAAFWYHAVPLTVPPELLVSALQYPLYRLYHPAEWLDEETRLVCVALACAPDGLRPPPPIRPLIMNRKRPAGREAAGLR